MKYYGRNRIRIRNLGDGDGGLSRKPGGIKRNECVGKNKDEGRRKEGDDKERKVRLRETRWSSPGERKPGENRGRKWKPEESETDEKRRRKREQKCPCLEELE